MADLVRTEIEAVGYSAAATAGAWGVMEIFLRIDPFTAVCFKHFFWLGVFLVSTAATMIMFRFWKAPTPMTSPTRAKAVLVVAAGLGLLAAVGLLLGVPIAASRGLCAYPAEHQPWTISAVVFLAVAMTCVLTKAIVTPRQPDEPSPRPWPPSAGVPSLIAIAVLGVFTIGLAIGRSQDIRTADIAQEELRAAGLGFSMASVQDAIYLVSPRSLNLFRLAGVNQRDVTLALAAPTDLDPDEPLAQAVMRRLSDGDLSCVNNPTDPRCRRIDAFLRVLAPSEDDELREICPNAAQPLRLPRMIADGAPPRPLLSHALTGGHGAVAERLIELCGGPDPFFDARPTRDARERRGPEQQVHLRATLDPHHAISFAYRHGDGLWTRDEAEHVRAALCANDVGVAPTGWSREDGPDETEPAECIATLQPAQVEALPEAASVLITGEDNCRIEEGELSFDEPQRMVPSPSSDGSPDGWAVAGELTFKDGRTERLVLQRYVQSGSGGQTRVVREVLTDGKAASRLDVFGWTADHNVDGETHWSASGDNAVWSFERQATSPPTPALHFAETDEAPNVRRAAWGDTVQADWRDARTIELTQPTRLLLSGTASDTGCLTVSRVDSAGDTTTLFSFPLTADTDVAASARVEPGSYLLKAGYARPREANAENDFVVIKQEALPCAPEGEALTAKRVALPYSMEDELALTEPVACALDFTEPTNLTFSTRVNADVRLEVIDTTGESIASADSHIGSVDDPETETVSALVQPGEKRILISRLADLAEPSTAELSLSAEQLQTIALGGNPIANKAGLAPGSSVGFRLDIDPSVRADPLSQIELTLSDLTADLDVFVRSDADEVISGTRSENASEKVRFSGAGPFFIVVRNVGSEISPFTLLARLAPPLPPLVVDGEPIHGYMASSDDPLTYRLDVEGDYRVEVRLDELEGDLDITARLDGIDVASSTNIESESESMRLDSPGAYEIEVSTIAADSPFTLTAQRLP